jgi:hypothetical protein
MENVMSVNIKKKYTEAISSTSGLSDESTTLLYKTPWVRILLEQHFEESDANRIEVEVSLPEDCSCDEKDASSTFDTFAEHINYLKKLREHGFDLCIIGEGCILNASKSVLKTPEDNLFRALLPP